ncbi:ornithine cyclodeaminase family protein [Luteolibacter arcticus]|uniref:Ornithine cyclodeaminase family protein n=1 Tax=Luteolibacter arcticus TaxID=1581411 RepID=A0ABT3GFV1_9BACT|nr:ornithine cyclodeaminase family protein [Luteolibacter arcticus]MCW1922444.1 ornithine cyclodeaminase family protein [Luteolibacter arcticus]
MKILEEEQVHAALRYPDFIRALREAFAGDYTMPPRQVMLLDPSSPGHEAFAMLPSWNDQVIALKAFTYFPQNQAPFRSLYSKILIFDRANGVPLALVDGASVTYWRTAGVSALAADFLARKDAITLFLLGTGRLAPYLIRAHASVRAIQRVLVWGRDPDKARALISAAAAEYPGISFDVAEDIQAACGEADVIVAATGSPDILVRGAWVKPGTHTDFLGNHHADKRECDTELVTRSKVYVDTRANCFREAGEILVPIAEGVFSQEQVTGELADLCRGTVPGRTSEEEITLFKSVGCALGDLCGALAVYRAGTD